MSTLIKAEQNPEEGTVTHYVLEDGFREPKRRGTGWLERAIADGSVRAPGAPDPDIGKDYSKAHVITVPLGTVAARAMMEGGNGSH